MNHFVHKGGLWVLAQNSLTLVVLVLGPMVHLQSWHWGWLLVGGAFFVVGAVVGIAGVRALGRSRTPYPKPLEAGQLVQTGIYRIVRHPLYTALILLTLGWSLLWSSGVALVAAFGLAGLLHAKARSEERWLRWKFPEYAAYSDRVRRFVPWLF